MPVPSLVFSLLATAALWFSAIAMSPVRFAPPADRSHPDSSPLEETELRFTADPFPADRAGPGPRHCIPGMIG